MPFYHKLGELPHKRHTQFRKPDGKLYREELMGLEGFSSIQSILYHHFLPPRVTKTEDMGSVKPEFVDFGPIQHRAFKTRPGPARGRSRLGAYPSARQQRRHPRRLPRIQKHGLFLSQRPGI